MQQAQIHELYDDEFYGDTNINYTSAKIIIPHIQELFGEIKSVIDVGCGVGTWLRAWSEINPGMKIFGIDGNGADEKLYEIPLESYKEVNLTHDADSIIKEIMTKCIDANNIGGGGGKPFALAQSLEVAEHLPKQYAHNFIKLLASLSDIVLFSAAIPYQGGTHHVNEQPPAYWADIFEKEGLVCFDILREKLWEEESISGCYKQNTLIFIRKNKQDILVNHGFVPQKPIYIVHPDLWEPNRKHLDYLLLATKNYMRFRGMIAKIPFLKVFYRRFIK